MTAPVAWVLLRRISWLLYPACAVALVYVVVGFTFHRTAELDASVWEDAAVPIRVIGFVLGVVATPVLLPVLVAHGVIRARFVATAGVVGALLAVAGGLYLIAGYLVERAVYGASDLPQALQGPHLYDSAGQLHLVFAEQALLVMAYQLGGFLIGTGYYGYHGWLGTALLLPGILAVATAEYVLGTGWVAAVLSALDIEPPDLPLAAATGLALAVIGIALAAGRALIRPVAIRTRRVS